MSKKDSVSKIKESLVQNDISNVRLVFCNASGIPCSKSWNATHLDDMVENGIEIFKGNYFMCLGISPSPHTRFTINSGDLSLVPDVETFSLLPYSKGSARFYGDLYDKDTSMQWECCARSLLKKTLLSLKEDEKFLSTTSGELEFYLVEKNPESTRPFTKLRQSSPPYSTQALDIESYFIDKAIRNLAKSGLDVTRIVREGGLGQYELNIAHSEGVRAGDDILTLREVIRGTAISNGMDATFMPKPFSDDLGSGMHIHQSLLDSKSGNNLFADMDDKRGNGLSSLAYQFVGGLLRHSRALCAVSASTVNSYKRLRPGLVSVDELKYGRDDRGAAVRIPRAKKSKDARVEYRVPDSACNPYLLISCIIAAGLDGIRRSLDPDLGPSQDDKHERLPNSLEEALREFKQDQILREHFGQTFFDEYIRLKEFELEIFNQHVSEFEQSKYGNYF